MGKGPVALLGLDQLVADPLGLDLPQDLQVIGAGADEGGVVAGNDVAAVADHDDPVVLLVVAGEHGSDGQAEGIHVFHRRVVIGHDQPRLVLAAGGGQVHLAAVLAVKAGGVAFFRVGDRVPQSGGGQVVRQIVRGLTLGVVLGQDLPLGVQQEDAGNVGVFRAAL